LDSARKIFERKIRYSQCRPMSEIAAEIVCPADSRVLFGSLRESSGLFLKSKFFDYEELLGFDKPSWLKAFDVAVEKQQGGDPSDADIEQAGERLDRNHLFPLPAAGLGDFFHAAGKKQSASDRKYVSRGVSLTQRDAVAATKTDAG
jgi:hypothetical protein